MKLNNLPTMANSLLMGSVIALSLPLYAQSELTTEQQKVGYAIGANIGSNIAGQGLGAEIDFAALSAGIQDAVSGSMKMTPEELTAVMEEFSTKQQAKQQVVMEVQAQAGRDFLANNASQPGVTTTASGLQYVSLTEAADASAAKPTASDTVKVHYHGTLTDGTVFDSSVERGEPISFPLNGVIPGWTEGLQLMNIGDKYRFFIPSDLAYGTEGAGPIPPNSTLIFEVELLAIEAPAAP
jgi:FKBP-type peptidyl-prolyl cis-trans isomerase